MRYIKVIMAAWVIYASFYLCRVNYSVALPFINSELGITFTSLGIIASAFFISYSVGQVINGYLGVKYRPWGLLIVSIVGSSVMSLLFGLSMSFPIFLALWLINGYFQSVGWPILVKVVAIILSHGDLFKGYAIFNTSWALGHALSWLLTGLIVEHYGWRWGFIINSMVFSVISIPLVLYLMRHVSSLKATEPDADGSRNGSHHIMFRKHVVVLLVLALVYSIMYAIRYALIVYLPSYVHYVERHISTFLITIVLFPISGSIGMISLGFLFNKVVMQRRLMLITAISILIAVLLLTFPLCFEESIVLGLINLTLLGASLYGAESQLASAIPVALIGRKYSSLAAGIIDSAGSIGAFISSLISGMIIDSLGFNAMLRFWGYMEMVSLILLLALIVIIKKTY